MLFRNPFRALNSGSRREAQRSQRRQPSPCRLAVEALEDRLVPASPWPLVPASLSVGDAVVFEAYNGSYAQVVVTLSEASKKPVTVNYSTADGTALAGSDYAAAFGTLTFARGETTKTILVPVIADGVAEPDETFVVKLSGATNATIADGQGVVTIVDDGVNDGYAALNDYFYDYWNYQYYIDNPGWAL